MGTFKTAYHIPVYNGCGYLKVMEFDCPRDGYLCLAALEDLKEKSKLVPSMKDGVSNRRYEDALSSWLECVRAYVTRWGPGYVPQDIRLAVHSAQSLLGVEATDFGEDVGVVGVVAVSAD